MSAPFRAARDSEARASLAALLGAAHALSPTIGRALRAEATFARGFARFVRASNPDQHALTTTLALARREFNGAVHA